MKERALAGGGAFITEHSQLVSFFANATKSPDRHQIGLSHECFLVQEHSGETPRATVLDDAFEKLLHEGWQTSSYSDRAATDGSCLIDIKNTGHTTLHMPPAQNIHELDKCLGTLQTLLQKCCTGLGLKLINCGYQPVAQTEDYRSASAASLFKFDFSSEADATKKFRVALALQPVITGMLANSALTGGAFSAYCSYRCHNYVAADSATGVLYRVAQLPHFSFSAYVDHLLAQPFSLITEKNTTPPATFPQFMKGQMPDYPDARPTFADWRNHLNSIPSEVCLMPTLSIAGTDSVSHELTTALAALWAGILYDKTALQDCESYIADWSVEELVELRACVAEKGLRTMFRGSRLSETALGIIKLAQQGLRRRAIRLHGGADETRYLEPLFLLAESGQCPADSVRMRLQMQSPVNIIDYL